MASTLLLDRTSWDLVQDAYGNIAVAQPPYALAQDVASAVRTFVGECWYDTSIGIPYFTQVLGHAPPASLVKALIVQQALTVPGVVKAVCYLTSLTQRTLSGQVHVTDAAGVTSTASF